jgi:alginate O-acetyltransferase complex protein AlgI
VAVVSVYFIVFIVLAVAAVRFVPAAFRVHVIFTASVLFILSFGIQTLLVAFASAGISFFAGRRLAERDSRAILFLTVTLHVAALIAVNVPAFHSSAAFSASFSFVRLLGFSYYTLSNIAYVVDVRSKRIKPADSFIAYVVSAIYFPKFVCGPITRYDEFVTAFKPRITAEGLISGGQRIVLGFFKKLVIADRLAPAVSSVFDHGDPLPGLTIISASFLFVVQVYFDFSGYTDIAIGASRMLGIHLPENFNFPFRARSLADFWRRWHMTLVGFLTAYIYFPVTYKLRRFVLGSAIGIVVTFLLSGLWHGIGVTFLLWSVWHALGLASEHLIRHRLGWSLFPYRLYAFLIIVFSYIFFRAQSPDSAYLLWHNAISAGSFLPSGFLADFLAALAVGGHQADLFNLYVTLAVVFAFLIYERTLFAKFTSTSINTPLLILAVLLIFLFGSIGDPSRFIYMQF